MKKQIISLVFLSVAALNMFGQNNEALESEINKLRDKANYYQELYNDCNAIDSLDTIVQIKSFNPKYNFKLISSNGTRSDQSVRLTFLVSHSLTNQTLSLDLDQYRGTAIYDEFGNDYDLVSLEKTSFYTVPYDTPLRFNLIVNGVMPGTEKFSTLIVRMSTYNVNEGSTGDFSTTEIRNIPIKW
jgi:hypothetical protein